MPIHEKSLIRPENLTTNEELVIDGVDVSGHWSTFIEPRVVTDYNEDLQDEIFRFSASGFRDFTRIAASDPVMWRDIFIENRDAVLEMVNRFDEDLTNLKRAIRRSDGDELHRIFTRTQEIRRGVIEARQDTPEHEKIRKNG